MWKIKRGFSAVCLLTMAILIGQADLLGQSSGRITGTVVESGTRAALPGANVVVQNTEQGGSTDNQGQFIIGKIPPGTYTVNVFFMGYETASKEVVVAAGETEKVDFALRSTVIQSDEVVVTAERLAQSQSTALNTQFNSNTIKNVIASDLMGRFPDNQAVEAMARIPGVSLTRDQGEGDMAIVRGLPPAWSSTTLNGEKVPSANGEGGRSVRLVNFPSDLIQTIEVSKALTADMDGDAIGGQVNLVTKDAPNRRLFTMSVRGGLTSTEAVHMGNYNFFGPRMVNLNIGDNLMDGKFGYLISGSYENNTVSTINRTYEYDWDEYGPGKTELYDRQGNMLEDGLNYTKKKQYEINRRRAGVNASLVFKPVLGQKFYVRGFYNDRQYDQWKWSLKTKYYKSLAERETDGSRLPKSTTNVTAGGEHVLRNNAKIDYHATFAQSHGYSHQLIRASFAQDFSDLSAPYTFNDNENRPREYKENDNVGAANFKQPFALGATHGTFQFGAKIRTKNRLQERYMYVSEPVDGEPAWTLPGGPSTDEYYQPFFFDPPIQTVVSNETNLDENYTADETISAGYAMAEIWATDRLMFLPGVRLERTDLSYETDANHSATDNFQDVLPSFHIRYNLTRDVNVRLAVTRALARPEYYDLVPYREENDDGDEVSMGNPGLSPSRATNLDLMVEKYSPMMAGVLSAGVFYKNIDGPIEEVNWSENGVIYYQPQNTGKADIKGAEFSVQQNLGFIGLRNFRMILNYTYLDAQVTLADGSTRPLSGQSKHLANTAVSYEHPGIGLSTQLSYQFIGRMLESTGESGRDIFEDDYQRLDFKLRQKVASGVHFVLEGQNLLNSPLHWIIQDPTGTWRTNEKEYYGRTVLTGFEFGF